MGSAFDYQAGVTVLCSWGRHFTLTEPLSTQEYHEWVRLWSNPQLKRSNIPVNTKKFAIRNCNK